MPQWPKPGRGKGESIYSGRRVAAKLKRAEAVELRIAGLSWAAIGEKLDVSSSMARKYVETACREVVAENVDQLRAIQGAQLNVILATLWPRVIDADHKDNTWCIDRALKVFERQAALFGLDAPTRIAQTDAAGNDVPFVIEVRSVDEHGDPIPAPSQPFALPDAT